MKKLLCDIQLGGSTVQYLTWSRTNLTREKFVNTLAQALVSRAKTKPFRMAKRSAALIVVVYDKLDGDSFYLDVIIDAIYSAENLLNK